MLYQVTRFPSFLRLHDIPLCGQTHFLDPWVCQWAFVLLAPLGFVGRATVNTGVQKSPVDPAFQINT